MAIKGNAYTKTSWAFEERPVASSKLNLWDDRMEAALELAYYLISQAWGGGDGVIRGAAADDLKVRATSPPSLAAEAAPGWALVGQLPYRLAEPTPAPPATPPATHPRIDLVQARLAAWDISVKPGVEAAEPEAPEADADAIPLARLHLRPGMTSIQDEDDESNGYIVDVRQFL